MTKPARIAADIGGRAKKVAARLTGERGILNTIKEEHAHVVALMRFVQQTGDVQQRKELFDEIRLQLSVHATAEEQEFYSILELHPETQRRVRHLRHQHEDLERIIERIRLMDPATTEWLEQFQSLEQLVHAHVDEEENEIFTEARQLFTPGDLESMDARYREAKAYALEEQSDGSHAFS